MECIAKGKSRTPYEFGVKVGIAMTLQHNLIVGARAFTGNPFDGHTLREQLEQTAILMQDTGVKPSTAYVDLGYRGVDADNSSIAIKHWGKFKTLTPQERKLLKRRQTIEPIIGHLKADHRMDRCHLKGEQGDRLHAVLCAAGYNLSWLLRTSVPGSGLAVELARGAARTRLVQRPGTATAGRLKINRSGPTTAPSTSSASHAMDTNMHPMLGLH